ncbi:MAG: LysR family transcriptional regulator [Planctomycetota bacterium]|nr:MAG: LysR family transcriptional regulator [Planctomycetota bacterium]
MIRPTLRQLEYFVAVAEHLNFRKAAEASHVSQPALSAQISQLEALLRVKLFERDSRGVMLTPAGTALLPGARETLAVADRTVEMAKSLGAPLTGPLRFGIIPTVGPYLLPQVLPALSEIYPELEIFLREDTTERLAQLVHQGKLDVLILDIDVELGGLVTRAMFEDPFVLAVPSGDPLAPGKKAQLTDLEGREVLLLDEGHCLREQTLPLCESAGGDELRGFRGSSLGTIAQMVAAGLGVTLLPKMAVEREAAAAPGLCTLPFGTPGPARNIGLAWRPHSPRAKEFQELAETIAEIFSASS